MEDSDDVDCHKIAVQESFGRTKVAKQKRIPKVG
jgi:hypothetical protein